MNRPYPRCHHSGVEWLDHIPEHWEVRRLAASVKRSDERFDPEDAPSHPSATPYIGLEHVESWTGALLPLDDPTPSGATANAFVRGDVLFGKLRPYLAKAFSADFDGMCSTEFLVLRPHGHNRRFLLHLLLTDGFIDLVDSSTYGAKMPRANWDFIRKSLLPLPPLREQRAIAAFLDRRTAEIDTLVETKRQLIERLAEYRTALVTRTVTRGLPLDEARAAGLDPCPPLRDSGVEWLGAIPEHWEVKRLSTVVERSDAKIDAEGAEGLPYVGLEHVVPWTGSLLSVEGQSTPESLSNRFTPGDVLFGKLRPYLAKVLPADFDGVCSTEFLVLRPLGCEQRYLFYLLLADGFVSRVDASTYGAKMPRASWDFIGNSILPVPPVAEQRAVAEFLDRKTSEVDTLCARVETAIERLQEYRMALVTAAVTGKIDVRAAATDGDTETAEMECCSA